ncbi:hypothetical protein P9112_009782 [Eukaryota sp. TZLM1-RC]
MAKDLTFAKHGASVHWVSVENPDFPSSNILDGDNRTFFYTTGLFPQEVVIAFPHLAKVSKLRTISQHIKEYEIFYSSEPDASNWVSVFSTTLPPKDKPHIENSSVAIEAAFIKIKVISAYSHFVKIYRIIAEGK